MYNDSLKDCQTTIGNVVEQKQFDLIASSLLDLNARLNRINRGVLTTIQRIKMIGEAETIEKDHCEPYDFVSTMQEQLHMLESNVNNYETYAIRLESLI